MFKLKLWGFLFHSGWQLVGVGAVGRVFQELRPREQEQKQNVQQPRGSARREALPGQRPGLPHVQHQALPR